MQDLQIAENEKAIFCSFKKIKDKIKKAVNLGFKNLIFTGQEVILHPDIHKIITFSFKNCQVNYLTFNTNGLGFANDLTWRNLESVREYLDKVYIAISVNFYNERTFSDWSGHGKGVFQTWINGVTKAINDNFLKISSLDIILKKDVEILKIINFLGSISGKKTDYQEGLRIIDLMPFGYAQSQIYKRLKYKLIETNKKISQIIKKYPGKIHFESFPICLFSQKDLKDKKYFIYNFHLSFGGGSPDPI